MKFDIEQVKEYAPEFLQVVTNECRTVSVLTARALLLALIKSRMSEKALLRKRKK